MTRLNKTTCVAALLCVCMAAVATTATATPGVRGLRGITCTHGGHPNREHNYCFGCLGAWGGPTCSVFNNSRVSIYPELLESLNSQGAAGVNRAAANLNPIPGWRNLGFTYDVTTNTMSKFPALAINFTNPKHVFISANGTEYAIPDQVTLVDEDPEGNAPPSISCTTFPTISDYFDMLASARDSLQGLIGILGDDPTTVQTQYFNARRFVTVCRAAYPIYTAAMPGFATAAKSWWMTEVVQSMPGNYSTGGPTASAFKEFINLFGTHYVTNTTQGALVTTVFQHAQCLVGGTAKGWSPGSIESQAQTAFTNILAGDAWNGNNVDPTFVAATGPPITTKLGGDPEMSLPGWRNTVAEAPVTIGFQFRDMYELSPYSTSQIALQKAITGYVFAANSVLSSATTTAASAAFTQWEGAEINWYTSRGSESTSNRGVVAMGSHPYNYLSTDHSLMPVSGDHGNMWIAQYGPVAYKCNTFYVTGAIGCYFKRTSSGIQAVTFTPMQVVNHHAICQVNECNGGAVCWGNIDMYDYRIQPGSSGVGASDGGCVSYSSGGMWPSCQPGYNDREFQSALPLGGTVTVHLCQGGSEADGSCKWDAL